MSVVEQDLDLRPYLLALLHYWKQIVLLAFLAAITACVITYLSPRSYEASATILMMRRQANLNLTEKYPTVAEPVDARSRVEAMLVIARSPAIAAGAIEALGESLPPKKRSLEAFMERVRVENKGDAILITASAESSAAAAQIANVWAAQTVAAINTAYNEYRLGDIQAQLQATQGEYAQRQATLEKFLETNPANLLRAQKDEASLLVKGLTDERVERLESYRLRLQDLEGIILQAEALKQQVQNGSQSEAAALGDALLVLQTRALSFAIQQPAHYSYPVGASAASPVSTEESQVTTTSSLLVTVPGQSNFTFDLSLADAAGLKSSPAAYARDLEAILALAEAEKSKTEQALSQLRQEALAGPGTPELEEAAQHLARVETALEREDARLKELTSQRDVAWLAYQSMMQKVVEITTAAPATNYVNLAAAALPPNQAESRGVVRNTVVGGGVGFILGIFLVLVLAWSKSFRTLVGHAIPQ